MVDVDVVLVAVVGLAVFLGPTRLNVLLAALARLAVPLLGYLAALYLGVLFARVTLLGYRYDRGINDLPLSGLVSLPIQVAIESLEQRLNHTVLYQHFPKQPDGGGIQYADFQVKLQETHEREPIFYLILGLLVAEVVQTLHHQNLEHAYRIKRFPPRIALAFLFLESFKCYRCTDSCRPY